MTMTRLLCVAALALLGCSDSDPEGGADGGGTGGSGGGFSVTDDLQIEVSPQAVTFGQVALGGSELQSVTVRHAGSSGTLRLTSVTLETESSELTLASPATTELEPGETTVLELTYAPTDVTQDSGTVRIATNVPAPGGGTRTVAVPITTLQQTVSLLAVPRPLNFGQVPSTETKIEALTLRSTGTVPVTLEGIEVLGGDGEETTEFALAEGPEPAAELAPGGEMKLRVSYAPVGEDVDQGILRLSYTSALNPEAQTYDVPLEGTEIRSRLVVEPNPLDFGQRFPDFDHEEVVTVANGGDHPLEITAIYKVETGPFSHTVKVLVEALEEPIVLEGDASWTFPVTFNPELDMPPSALPLAEIAFESNDPDGEEGVLSVPVFGKRRGPGLEVTPPDLVYFGYVHVTATVERQVTLYNAGNNPLSVNRIWIEGAFEVENPEGWGPTKPVAEPAELAAGEVKTLDLRFTNEGGEWTTAWGTLHIESDDIKKPEWDVLLNARAAGEASCLMQLVPDELPFGFVQSGTSRALTVDIVNVGTKPCGYGSVAVHDCGADNACPIPADVDPMDLSPLEGTSARWTVTGEPEVAPDNLLPGESLPLELTFTAPELEGDEKSGVYEFFGLLNLKMTALNASGEVEATVLPYYPNWGTANNLSAVVAAGQVQVTPPVIEFGLTPVGCQSETQVVTATNIGPLPVQILGWSLEGCSIEVKLLTYPPLDEQLEDGSFVAVIEPGETVEFGIAYAPENEGVDACELRVETSDTDEPSIVTIQGEGSFDGEWTDVFTDSQSQPVDVLFVVDDSGSMNEEQENLMASFQSFIEKAAEWQSDYQIGVTTTTVNAFEGGILRGNPRFVTPYNWEKFIPNVEGLGVTGSGIEQGMWAAKIALSPPLTDVTTEPCETDDDCPGLLHGCIETAEGGICGGLNMGFLREEASLEIVFVSDEEDQSPESLTDYVNFFTSLKGFNRPDQLHVHSIVGPPGGCESINGTAWAGLRYRQLALDTGGIFYSICELDFSKGLEGIGEIAFAAQMEYFLTHFPAPTSITVTINGLPCPLITAGVFNFVYDADKNSVTLTEQGICSAGPGDLVEIHYDLLCFATPTEQ